MFGVTVEEVSAMVVSTPMTATSTLSVAQIEAWITTHDLIVQGIYEAKGVVLSSIEVGSVGYAYGHQAVLNVSCSQVLRAIQGRYDEAAAMRVEYDKSIADLKAWVHLLGESAPDDFMDVSASNQTTSLQERIINGSTTLRSRMVRNNCL